MIQMFQLLPVFLRRPLRTWILRQLLDLVVSHALAAFLCCRSSFVVQVAVPMIVMLSKELLTIVCFKFLAALTMAPVSYTACIRRSSSCVLTISCVIGHRSLGSLRVLHVVTVIWRHHRESLPRFSWTLANWSPCATPQKPKPLS